MLVILLNGAPGAGKDTVANLVQQDPICERFDNVLNWKFAAPLKMGAHILLGLRQHIGAYEDTKDQKLGDFFGKTPREVYIALSETFMKPLFGQNVFGKVAANRLKELAGSDTVVTFSDCGFVDEVKEIFPILRPQDKVALIRIRRPGKTFENDSRSYLEPEAITHHTVHPQLFFAVLPNDGTLGELNDALAPLLEEIYAWYTHK